MFKKIALAAVTLTFVSLASAQPAEVRSNPDQSGTSPGSHAQAPAVNGKHKSRHPDKHRATKASQKDGAIKRNAKKAGAAIEKGAVKTRDAIRHTGDKINAATAPAPAASGMK